MITGGEVPHDVLHTQFSTLKPRPNAGDHLQAHQSYQDIVGSMGSTDTVEIATKAWQCALQSVRLAGAKCFLAVLNSEGGQNCKSALSALKEAAGIYDALSSEENGGKPADKQAAIQAIQATVQKSTVLSLNAKAITGSHTKLQMQTDALQASFQKLKEACPDSCSQQEKILEQAHGCQRTLAALMKIGSPALRLL